ncbi:hypothetical protein AVEN_122493-1 [Araneus ventricosus]|uniref:Gustatory receptor n=1 Tax=Araneus ventricosus TaxID=182803 RepID=A0A4Y2Q6F4_ARAVE|nr:hypothetical protein AVEN_122493-1 [Araneus ventricosus]
MVLVTIHGYLCFEAKDSEIYWTYRQKIDKNKYRFVVGWFGTYAFHVVCMEYPCIITFSMSILMQQCEGILLQFQKNIKNAKFSTPAQYYRMLNDYNTIEDKILLLQAIMSKPLFLILSIGFLSFYSSFMAFFLVEYDAYDLTEVVSNCFTATTIIVSVTIYRSRIPERILEIKRTIRSVIDEQKAANQMIEREISALVRIEQKEVVHLTACGLVYLERTFLLSAFGTVFTYGLLISNLKFTSF